MWVSFLAWYDGADLMMVYLPIRVVQLVYSVGIGSAVYVCLNHDRAKVGWKWGIKKGGQLQGGYCGMLR
jgi:hypothetical protein